jgi:hypothetical protein
MYFGRGFDPLRDTTTPPYKYKGHGRLRCPHIVDTKPIYSLSFTLFSIYLFLFFIDVVWLVDQ